MPRYCPKCRRGLMFHPPTWPCERTAMQRHSNYMLYMRRMMGEIEFVLRLQDTRYVITDEEAFRVMKELGWDEAQVNRVLSRIMEELHELV